MRLLNPLTGEYEPFPSLEPSPVTLPPLPYKLVRQILRKSLKCYGVSFYLIRQPNDMRTYLKFITVQPLTRSSRKWLQQDLLSDSPFSHLHFHLVNKPIRKKHWLYRRYLTRVSLL